MKRITGILMAVILLFACLSVGATKVSAAKKSDDSRAIAIVFDNSGSMYLNGSKAWCRATYAMEVFASMLNKGDTLLIYPMWPIEVNGTEYTMEQPLKITDSKQSSDIREIYTAKPLGTPIESVDFAIQGVKQIDSAKRYVIVLTDGEEFYRDNVPMGITQTKSQLDSIIQNNAGPGMTMMYLGIGAQAAMPDTPASENFAKKQAVNNADVLSSLTEMCNQIFGRDTLPKSHISGKTIDFDISMNKLIVFVQGENISDLKMTDESGKALKAVSKTATKYSTKGSGTYDSVADTSLQGMMVTYGECDAGKCTISHSGTATSIEVYYEPDADLDFVFTDSEGNSVDPESLYEGDYKVSFGMKDAKTGELISSDLLGTPNYQGEYSINDVKTQIVHDGHSGYVSVPLKMNDTFDANLTVTYLGGYRIRKDSSDFGWPFGGIKVAARPAGNLKFEISGGDDVYSLQDLKKGKPYTAKIYYEGKQLTGAELESVDLKWNPDTSNALITKEFAEDHYKLWLSYKDPAKPENTKCGTCTVKIYAHYSEEGGEEAVVNKPLTYMIKDDFVPVHLDIYAPNGYLTISELEESSPIIVSVTIKGEKLTAEDFAAVKLNVDCGGIEHTVTSDAQDSSFAIKLLPTDKIAEGDYVINVVADYKDHIGRATQVEDSVTITLGKIPMWLKWLFWILLLILLIIIILLIMHIKVLPKKAHITRAGSSMLYNGSDVTTSTTFDAKIDKGQMRISSVYGGIKSGLAMNVKPGKQSYLKKHATKRSAEVAPASVRKYGAADISEVSIGSVRYELDPESGKLERTPPNQKPFEIRHGTTISYSGTMLDGGIHVPFTVTTKLNCKKK